MTKSNDKPLVSFLLFAYNQEQYIREAVEGAFSQTYSPLEIILSDDCSSDRTFDIMKGMAETYNGPHKLVLNRNAVNLGIAKHFNMLVASASGEIIELAAGDDISLPSRTEETVKLFQDNPGLAALSLQIIPFQGSASDVPIPSHKLFSSTIFDLKRFLADPNYHLNAPARAFSNKVHKLHGPISEDCLAEDSGNLLRCLLTGPVLYHNIPAVLYRRHDCSITTATEWTRQSFEAFYCDYLLVIDNAAKNELLSKEKAQEARMLLAKKQIRRILYNSFRCAHSDRAKLIVQMVVETKLTHLEKIVIIKECMANTRAYNICADVWRRMNKSK